MKNILLTVLIALSTTSCAVDAYVSDPIHETEYTQVYTTDNEINIIITNGTPYYYNGRLWYYHYNGLYYYPFWYGGYWYLRPYTTLYSWDWYSYHYYRFRPGHHDVYRFRPGNHGFYRPWRGLSGRPLEGGHRPNITPRPGGHRPSIHSRPRPGGSTRPRINPAPRHGSGPSRPLGGGSHGGGRRH